MAPCQSDMWSARQLPLQTHGASLAKWPLCCVKGATDNKSTPRVYSALRTLFGPASADAKHHSWSECQIFYSPEVSLSVWHTFHQVQLSSQGTRIVLAYPGTRARTLLRCSGRCLQPYLCLCTAVAAWPRVMVPGKPCLPLPVRSSFLQFAHIKRLQGWTEAGGGGSLLPERRVAFYRSAQSGRKASSAPCTPLLSVVTLWSLPQ